LEKRPARSSGEWAGIQCNNVTVPGDGALHDFVFEPDGVSSAFFYASPFDNDIYSFNFSDHKIYIAEGGVYEFKFAWFFNGSGTITNANAFVAAPTQQIVVEMQVMGQPRGALKAQGLHIRSASYPDEEISYPQGVYFTASQNSGGDMNLIGQIMIQRTCETAHTGTADPFPTAFYPAGSQIS